MSSSDKDKGDKNPSSYHNTVLIWENTATSIFLKSQSGVSG